MEEVFTLDENGTIVSASHSHAQALLGYTNKELAGKNIATVLTPLPTHSQVPAEQQSNNNDDAVEVCTTIMIIIVSTRIQ